MTKLGFCSAALNFSRDLNLRNLDNIDVIVTTLKLYYFSPSTERWLFATSTGFYLCTPVRKKFYFVNICIHSKYRKIRTRENLEFELFSRSGYFQDWSFVLVMLPRLKHIKTYVLICFSFFRIPIKSLTNKTSNV